MPADGDVDCLLTKKLLNGHGTIPLVAPVDPSGSPVDMSNVNKLFDD